jgi:hypothetical protein
MTDFGNLKLSNRPGLPFLNSALVQIGRELSHPELDSFSPFGMVEGFVCNDPDSEMAKSLKTAPSGVGLLRFRQDRFLSLQDLPKLTASMGKVRAKPPKTTAAAFSVTPRRIEISKSPKDEHCRIEFEHLQAVRIDRAGRFFFIGITDSSESLCWIATPWIVPALALLMADAARRGALRELESDIDRKVQNR